MFTTAPFDARGYVVGETLGVQVTFSEAVEVRGAPVLRLGIGEEVRQASWDEDTSHGAFVAFRYSVTFEDRDDDGISVGADALDAGDGAIRNANGIDASLDIGDHVVEDDAVHRVLGAPPPQACTNARTLALRHDAQWTTRGLVPGWNGTPFRVDTVNNFPDSVPPSYLEGQLDAIGWLADRIEAQLGYKILERGEVIPVPASARPGWDQDWSRFWENPGWLPREPGQILAHYLNDDGRSGWDDFGGPPMSAHVCCGSTSYNRRFFEPPHWTSYTGANSPEGQAIVHEVFHLLGFKHYFDQHDLVGVQMSPGGLDRPWTRGSPVYYAAWTDIENLRCIFPKGG